MKKEPKYKVSLSMAGQEYNAEGETVFEGVTKLNYPKTIKAGYLTVRDGAKSKTLLLYPRMLNKFKSGNKMFQEIYAKRLTVLLK